MNTREFYIELLKRLEIEPEVKIATDLNTGGKTFCCDDAQGNCFVEVLSGKPSIVICGAGHVSMQLSAIMKQLDWYVTVVDDRKEFLTAERFPGADELFYSDFRNLKDYEFSSGTFYVIMTRGHKNDFDCLIDIINRPFGYMGMIGSQKKVDVTVSKLKNIGISKELISKLHAPIGFPIGAQTPAEIAVSIAAEIINEFYKKRRGYLESDIRDGILSEKPCVMATIIEKSGSAPRGKGTRMLIFSENICGTIGGGTLEASVMKDAINIDGFLVKEYDMTDETASELGMICGGKIKVMFEKIL